MIVGKRCIQDIKIDAENAYLAFKDGKLDCYHARRYNTNVTYAANEKEAMDVYVNVFGEDVKSLYSKVKQMFEESAVLAKAIKENSAF